jgi:hypothetical protein
MRMFIDHGLIMINTGHNVDRYFNIISAAIHANVEYNNDWIYLTPIHAGRLLVW